MCDKYTEQVLIHSDPTTNKTMEKNKLHRIIKSSKVTKGRLVHYYSRSEADIKKDINPDFAFSSWCGWHNDHGSLTGVVPALYFKDGKIIEDGSPDPLAGLYVKSNHSVTFTDRGSTYTKSEITSVSFLEHETNLNDAKRNIDILRPELLDVFMRDIKNMMEYKDSSQYITDNLKRTQNPRIISP